MNKIIIPAICAVAGVAVGAVGGFFFAKAKYEKAYQDRANDEIKEFIKHYEEKNPPVVSKGEDDHNDISDNWKQEAVKDFPKEEWEKSIRRAGDERVDYRKKVKENYDKSKDEEKPETEYKMESESDDWDRQEFDDPYLITPDEHYEAASDWEMIELEWDIDKYILSDIDGNIYPYPDETIGMENLRHVEDHPDQDNFVRNERDGVDYRISLKSIDD